MRLSPSLCRRGSMCVVVLLFLSLPRIVPAATWGSLSQRLPADTDTIVAVNVEKVLSSPFAKENQWRETMAENWARRPQVVPPGVKKLLMGAEFVPSKAETMWEVTLMDMDKMPALKDLAAAEGGTIDRVWNIDAVASPINAYFVPVDQTVLAVCTPGERSVISRWVRQPLKDDTIKSAYTKAALARLDEDTGVLMALDLEGAYSLPRIRQYLQNADLPELKDQNLDRIAQTISTLKGLRVHMGVGSQIDAYFVISFDKDTSSLAKAAKPLFISVLKTAGMYIEDIEQWTFKTEGNDIRASGQLSEGAFKNLLGVVQTPIPAVVAAAPAPAGAATGAPADPAIASQRYFKAVSLTLDNLKTGGSMGETATFWGNAANRIDKLPILNVDPALVAWGTDISMKLRQLAAGGKVGQTSIQARVAGVAQQRVDTSYYDQDGNYYYRSHEDPETGRQRKQAALEQKTALQQQALQIFNEANGSRQKIRQEMTAKYSVEF